jgi:hypothetical protein
VEADGLKFASKKEARRYADLKLLQRAGEVRSFAVHPWYPLLVDGQIVGIASGMAAVSEVPLAEAVAAAVEFEVVCDWDFADPKEGVVLNGQRWRKAGEIRAKFERTAR